MENRKCHESTHIPTRPGSIARLSRFLRRSPNWRRTTASSRRANRGSLACGRWNSYDESTMATLLPDDFREFLKLCNRRRVKYLLIGGYAVGYHGNDRATADMDVWIEISNDNAARMVKALIDFGFGATGLSAEPFATKGQIVRMGVPPLRLEILNEHLRRHFRGLLQAPRVGANGRYSRASHQQGRPDSQQNGERPFEGSRRPRTSHLIFRLTFPHLQLTLVPCAADPLQSSS